MVDLLTTQFRAWDLSADATMKSWLVANSRQISTNIPSVEDLSDCSFQVEGGITTGIGNFGWDGVNIEIIEPTDRQSTVLLEEDNFVFYIHPSLPGLLLIFIPGVGGSGDVYMWTTFEAIPAFIEIFRNDLNSGVAQLESIYETYLDLRRQIISAVMSQTLTLRVRNGIPVTDPSANLFIVVFQPQAGFGAKLVTALSASELAALQNSPALGYLVDSRDNFRVVVTANGVVGVDTQGVTLDTFVGNNQFQPAMVSFTPAAPAVIQGTTDQPSTITVTAPSLAAEDLLGAAAAARRFPWWGWLLIALGVIAIIVVSIVLYNRYKKSQRQIIKENYMYTVPETGSPQSYTDLYSYELMNLQQGYR